jgi:membrane-associated HD superfamily phosphohydrolase
LAVASVVAAILGIIANAHYGDVFDDQKRADMTATIRMVSSAVALAVTVICTCVVLWSNLGLQRVHKRPVLILTSVCILLSIVAINRLSVMRCRMNSLSGFNPLNSSASKVTFYTLHIFPEWVATFVLLLAEVRKTFGTGPFGDLRWQDETPMEKKKETG